MRFDKASCSEESHSLRILYTEAMASGLPVLFEGESRFEHYRVVDVNYFGREARVLYSGDGVAAQSGLAQDGRAELLFDYNQRFIELIDGLLPSRILLIGGGACTLPLAIMEKYPAVRVDVIERDPLLPELAGQYFGFHETDMVKVRITDGWQYLAEAHEPYDMILIDVFVHASVPAQFQTSELGRRCRRLLAEHGVVAMNVIAAYHGRHAALLGREVAAFQGSFGDVQLFPASNGISYWTPQNFVLTAQHDSRDLQKYMRFAAVDTDGLRGFGSPDETAVDGGAV